MFLINQLNLLLERSTVFGLSEVYVKQACEFLEHREYGLCFDTVVTQMFEFDLPIDKAYYFLVIQIANNMSMPENEYAFMHELVR